MIRSCNNGNPVGIGTPLLDYLGPGKTINIIIEVKNKGSRGPNCGIACTEQDAGPWHIRYTSNPLKEPINVEASDAAWHFTAIQHKEIMFISNTVSIPMVWRQTYQIYFMESVRLQSVNLF